MFFSASVEFAFGTGSVPGLIIKVIANNKKERENIKVMGVQFL
jgi:hypothetical protein